MYKFLLVIAVLMWVFAALTAYDFFNFYPSVQTMTDQIYATVLAGRFFVTSALGCISLGIAHLVKLKT